MSSVHRKTRSVRVGSVIIGSDHPIAIQSMTTTTPEQIPETLAQIRALRDAGCALVRLAVPTARAARALAPLRRAMQAEGLQIPLVADVHFLPDAALEAARHVEKVRINPGNFASSSAEARTRLEPLVARLRKHGAVLRIGVNHGSLSAYVADEHGHGPTAMVASALEYLHYCRALDFDAVVVSLKASNPALMVAANRLLAQQMDAAGFDGPIHLGVTEAGEGREGELRSAVGIGALLLEGIGDTIRVSLTGDPVTEIAAAERILRAIEAEPRLPATPRAPQTEPRRPVAARWRDLELGGSHPPRVELKLLLPTVPASSAAFGNWCTAVLRACTHESVRAESLMIRPSVYVPRTRRQLRNLRRMLTEVGLEVPIWSSIGYRPFFEEISDLFDGWVRSRPLAPDRFPPSQLTRWSLAVSWGDDNLRGRPLTDQLRALNARIHQAARRHGHAPALTLGGPHQHDIARWLAAHASAEEESRRPLLTIGLPLDNLGAAISLGTLLLDGCVDVITVSAPSRSDDETPDFIPVLETAYDLLQATRRRLSRIDFISCPGCGRLSYDLTATVRRLKARLGHLRDIKIAVMGCAVNGPGEMAGADFGYVGSVEGKVDLYVGDRRVRRGLRPAEADEQLIALLREHGCWRPPA